MNQGARISWNQGWDMAMTEVWHDKSADIGSSFSTGDKKTKQTYITLERPWVSEPVE